MILRPIFAIAQVFWKKQPDKNKLSVLITTTATCPFEIRSITEEDIPLLAEKIYNDPETMQHFGTGKCFAPERTNMLCIQVLKTMENGNPCPPATMLGIYKKKQSQHDYWHNWHT